MTCVTPIKDATDANAQLRRQFPAGIGLAVEYFLAQGREVTLGPKRRIGPDLTN